MAREPNHAHVERAVLAAELGTDPRLPAVFEELLAVFPESIMMRRWLGSAWLNAGELDRAEEQALAVLELAPERDTAWFKLGVIRMEQGRLAEAQKASPDLSEDPILPATYSNRLAAK